MKGSEDTSGLVVNEKPVSEGRIPPPSEIMTLLTMTMMGAEQIA